MIPPRTVPDRDSKYMGIAWMQAAFSKDPSTQMGSIIVGLDNKPLGSGYNGPPANIDDHCFSWERPPKDNPEAFSKYDVIRHAEENAISHSRCEDLVGATVYITGYPCKRCMLDIVNAGLTRVVYMDYKSDKGSMCRSVQRDVSEKIMGLRNQTMPSYKLLVEEFQGNLIWLPEWINNLQEKGILPTLD